MSKLNHLFNAEKILCYQTHQKWGDNVMKACPSKQWSLDNVVNHLLLIKCLKDQPCHKLGMFLSTYGQPLMFLDDINRETYHMVIGLLRFKRAPRPLL